MKNSISKLSKLELLEFVKLDQTVKSKTIGVRLSVEEHQRYEELARKHGTPLSALIRKSLFSNLYHYQGIAQK